MKNRWILAVIFSVVMFCGCYDGKEMDERDFVIAMGIDSADNGFSVSMGIAGGNGNEEGAIDGDIKTNEGTNFPAAIELFTGRESRDVYYGHMKTLVVSEDVLNDQEFVDEIMDTFMRNSQFSEKIVLFSSGNAENVLRAVSENEYGDGLNIWDFYKNNSVEVLNVYPLNLKEFSEKFLLGECSVIPVVTAGDEIKIGGGLIYSPEGVKGRLTEEEMRGYVYVKDNAGGSIEELENRGAVEITKSSAGIKFEDDSGLKCVIDICVRGKTVNMLEGGVEETERKLEEKIEKSVLDVIDKTLFLETDVFGMAQSLKRRNNDIYEKYQGLNLDNVNFDVNVEVKITSSGVIH
ncbi:MAG: hypothetical protein HFE62_04405 [Firmicutes bacterium]|nr:hypothetical protein [Bacillota bacterium]